jgi:ribonuclease HII
MLKSNMLKSNMLKSNMLKTSYCNVEEEVEDKAAAAAAAAADASAIYEIGTDEAGRGPMLGRVYAAAVILPKDATLFKHEWMKDSKKFHSEKKIKEVATYIKENATAWAVAYATEQTIDECNIRNATHKAMHDAIRQIMANPKITSNYHNNHNQSMTQNTLLLVDGNDFTPFMWTNTVTQKEQKVPHVCIEGGDNTYSCIAAASILAKVSRDAYIAELCAAHPDLNLDVRYGLLKNKGYGTKTHMDGIKKYGISPFHRKSFGICRDFATTAAAPAHAAP